MASAYHHQPFTIEHYLQQTLSVDGRHSLFDDDEPALDENILENSALLESPLDLSPLDRRRESVLEPNTLFSPTHHEWDFDHDMTIQAGPADDSASVPAVTFEHSSGTNNPFIKLEQAQPAYAPPNWASSRASGDCTPAVYDNNAYPHSAFDESTYLPPSLARAFDNNSTPTNIHIPPQAVFQRSAAPISSTTMKDWTPTGPSSPDHDAAQSFGKRMRQPSPPATHSPLQVRRDGIRKKNARFDIPAERTLMNIDQLIARSQDENEIKELKQQKRLLRNRQAALDSRQRKKQHTERLEEEKKLHNAVIQELEDKLQQMTIQEDQLRHRIQEMSRERDILTHTFQMEKEDMVRYHTLETCDLRKKNTYLQEQLRKMEAALERTPMAHQRSSSSFSDSFDFENGFDVDTHCWQDSMSVRDVTPVIKTEKVTSLNNNDSEKPAAPGLLLILLLCGAFVASSKTSTPLLPPFPKQIQSASASVLQNIFQDAGVSEASRVDPLDKSAESWVVAKSDRMVGLESTMSVLNSFDKTTLEQQHEQFVQLTPSEYNDVTSANFLREPEPVNQRTRRRIQENLSMRSNKASAAEVYTRSLLWDRVDAEVVRRFAAFARQAQSAGGATTNESGGAATCHS